MKILGIVLTLLVISGIVLFIYFNYNPQKEEESINLSISTEYNHQKIKTQLEITSTNGTQFLNTSQYYEIIQVPKGEITIKNKNIENQDYYQNIYKYNVSDENTRLDIKLEKPILPKITIIRINPLIIDVKSENFQGVNFCLISSVNLVFVSANYTEIKKPDNYSNYDSCYGTFDLGEKIIKINYESLSNPTKDDFLNITFYDKEGNTITKRLI